MDVLCSADNPWFLFHAQSCSGCAQRVCHIKCFHLGQINVIVNPVTDSEACCPFFLSFAEWLASSKLPSSFPSSSTL